MTEFRAKQGGYMARQLHLHEDTLAVMELMQRHGLKRSVEFYMQRCKMEFAAWSVRYRRLQEHTVQYI